MLYFKYSSQLKDIFGEKVYKLPINSSYSCPNRDGYLSYRGCTFCGEEGGGFETATCETPVITQLLSNMEHIRKKYKAKKFIAYFQNFTNTYMPLSKFKEMINSACIDNICGIIISTRPDCISAEYLDFLKNIELRRKIRIGIELGLQTVQYRTLVVYNRKHSLASFIESSILIKKYGFDLGVHLILNLPEDNINDTIENAKILSALEVDNVKLHALYIVKGTQLAKNYEENPSIMDKCTLDDYIEKAAVFLAYLKPDIAVQRLIGRAPKTETVFVNWQTSWWKIRDYIENYMINNNLKQGSLYSPSHSAGLRPEFLVK